MVMSGRQRIDRGWTHEGLEFSLSIIPSILTSLTGERCFLPLYHIANGGNLDSFTRSLVPSMAVCGNDSESNLCNLRQGIRLNT